MSIYYKVPISYYHLYLKKGSREGLEFTRKKLNLYKNWKRQLVIVALKLGCLPVKKINSNADILFKGERDKEIYFGKKKIITHGDCKADYEIRKKMNRYFNCIKNPHYTKEKLEEDLIWPTKDLTQEDLTNTFKNLIQYYQKNTIKMKEKELKCIKEQRLKIKIGETKTNNLVESTIVHGDFWRGNFEKDSNDRIWLFDWGYSGRGSIVEDLINYFLIEFFYTRRINEVFFLKIVSIFNKNFSNIESLIFRELGEHQKWRPLSDKLILSKFKYSIKKILSLEDKE